MAPILMPQGGFGIDGNLTGGDPTAGIGDWLPATGDPLAGVLDSGGNPLNPTTTFHFIDGYGGNNDLIFSGGLKWTDNPNTWSWTSGKPSSKTEINNVLLHIATDASGHTWTAIAADRASTSGDSYIDFEFLQYTLVRNANGSFVSSGPNGGRTTNDILLSLAFTGGGKVPDFLAYRWQAVPGGGFAYVDATASLPIGRVFVAVNTNSVPVPYGAFGQTTYTPFAFAEAAIDLTALLGNFDQCLSMGFKTIMVKTKASASSTASIEDFIDPIQYSLQIGPSANAGPDQTVCTSDATTLFNLNGKATPGLQPVSSTMWSVVSGSAVIENPSALVTKVAVTSSSAVLRLTATQANGCEETDDVVLTVIPKPEPSIAGPNSVCPGSTNQFVAPAGLNAYSWIVTGNGSLAGSATGRTVNVIAGGDCGVGFTVTLNTVSNICSMIAQMEVMVNDLTPPKLTVPKDVVLECPADTTTNATGIATATDDCGKVSVTFTDAVTNTCGNTLALARTWIAADRCGNLASAVQNIVVQDRTPPKLTAPPNMVLECPAEPSTNLTGVAIATDTCGSVVIIYSDVVSNSCGGTKVVSRTWTAVDQCGNPATALQVITVRDTTAPKIFPPPSVVLECPGDVSTNANGVATGNDLCGTVSITYSDIVSNACGGTKVVNRTWTATDECGNAASALQVLTVRDTKAPALVAPRDLVLECPADVATNATGVAVANDLCGSVLVTYSDSISNSCGVTKTVRRTWTATDECGNVTTALQTIAVRDTTQPTLSVPPNLTLECPADTSTNKTGVATATDAGGKVIVQYVDAIASNCGATKVVTRTWTATDECGNSRSGVQTITVKDSIPPALVAPPNITLDCPNEAATNTTGTAYAQDLCGSVVVTFKDSVNNVCGGARTIARLWTATDDCGNTTNSLQVITVQDKAPPSLVMPPNLVLECPADTRTNATGVPISVDACGSVTLAYSDIVSNSCGGTKLVTRRWTATDECGNATNGVQTITVKDTVVPTLRIPRDVVLECPGDTRTNVTGVATAQDGCGSVSITYSDIVSNSCASTLTLWRLWTAADQCGNVTNGLQTIVVVDTTKPTITCPTIRVQCEGDVPAPYADLTAFRAAGGKAVDACDTAIAFALVSSSEIVGKCPGTITRIYRVTDACGNYADATQSIIVDDTIAPVLIAPTNGVVECNQILDPASTGRATATDNCSTNVAVTYTDAIVPSEYSLKWYAADPNPSHAPYDPTYIKVSPRDMPYPDSARLTGRAADPLRNAVAYGPTAGQLDALTSLGAEPMCFGQIVPFEVVIEHTGSPGAEKGTIEFTGNWSTHTTSNDQFGYDKAYLVYGAFVDYADPGSVDQNNNARVESFSSALVAPGSVNEQIEGKFRVSGIDVGDRIVVEIWVVLNATPPDHLGGTIAAELASAQKATLPPQPITTGAQTVSIGNLSKMTALPAPQAQPPLGPLPPEPPTLPGYLVNVIDRTWIATDDCGNQATRIQRFTVRDTTPPAIVTPADLALEYPADTSTNITGVATAADVCGQPLISFTDTVTNTCGLTKVTYRTWVATDGYNSTSTVQVITVRDSSGPTLKVPIICTFAAETVMNEQLARLVQEQFAVVFSKGVTLGIYAPTNADEAPNGIRWEPDSAGVASFLAALTGVTSGAGAISQDQINPNDFGTGGQLARQAALLSLNIGFNEAGLLAVGPNNLGKLVYTRDDDSLNSLTVAEILRAANTALGGGGTPAGYDYSSLAALLGEINSAFADSAVSDWAVAYLSRPMMAIQCANQVPDPDISKVQATDLAGAVTLASLPDVITNYQSPNHYDIVRSFLGIDECGNSNTCSFVIQVNDTTAPTFRNMANRTVSAGESWGFDDPEATDNCGSVLVRQLSTITNSGPNSTSFAIRTWEAIDEAGNITRWEQTIAILSAPTVTTGPVSYDVAYGQSVTLAVNATGSGPLSYQWQLNGVDIAGATDSSFTIEEATFADAGVYKVLIGNAAGNATSGPAVVNVLPKLAMQLNGRVLSLTWPAPFVLQWAATVDGPYWDAPNATSPFTYDTASAPQKYFRLRAPPLTLQTSFQPDGTTLINVSGAPGLTYLIQASSDLVHWKTIATTTVPASVVDEVTDAPFGRYYRAIPILSTDSSGGVRAPEITANPLGQTATMGSKVTLTVGAAGAGPLRYQWRFNDTDIPGATGSSLTLNSVQTTDSGSYRVIVGNAGGTVFSAPASLIVVPVLIANQNGRYLVLSWGAAFVLQNAVNVDGPYTDVPGAKAPYTFDTALSQRGFFRLRSGTAGLPVTDQEN